MSFSRARKTPKGLSTKQLGTLVLGNSNYTGKYMIIGYLDP